MQININTNAAVSFTNKLEKLSRSALPVAVRSTLNSAAFDVKQKSMPLAAGLAFEQRKKNFFQANSKVTPVGSSLNLKSMKATVGFIGAESKQAVADLEKQEHGGSIGWRSFIPIDTARTGNSNSKLVKKQNQLRDIRNIIDARNAKGKNKKQRFIKSVIHAGKGGFVLAEHNGKTILWRVNSLNRIGGKKGGFKLTPLYSYEQGRNAKINTPTHFMQKASNQSAGKMEGFFIIEAKKQINKLK